jgi:uncharacterized protein DUF222/HNH endonuclease
MCATLEHMFASVGDSDEATLGVIAERRREIDASEAAWLALVAAYERSSEWRADGYGSAAAALASECHMTEGVARMHVELARTLEEMPVVAEAFAAGEVSRQHASVIAKACTPERAGTLLELAPTLVAAATRMHPRELSSVVQHVVDRLDGDGGEASDEALRARRGVRASKRMDRMVSSEVLLDPEGGEVYLTALTAEMQRDRRKDETRTASQRRGDALVNICRRSLDEGTVGGTRKARPHITLVVDLEKHAERALLDHARAEAAHTGHVSENTLRRLTCDCNISRILTAGKGEILDVGRATRTIPPAIWRALVVRDRHCSAPGCDRPPGGCEAHHVWHWEDGGPTSLENLTLLCWYHHHEAHKHDGQRRGP